MEIIIGIKHLTREVAINTSKTEEEVLASVVAALEAGTILSFTDEHGRTTLIPADSVGFVEIGGSAPRRVGFGAL